MRTTTTKNLALAAMFVAIGLMLPFLTGQIPQFGNMMLPMHIPVFLCCLICGWRYGTLAGFILPPLRYLVFGMPVLYPVGIAMAFELAAYGLIAGLLYERSRRQGVSAIYIAMVTSMIGGRIVWATAQVVLLSMGGNTFTWQMFIAGAFLNAIPGIIIQLTLIPAIMVALNSLGLVRFQTAKNGKR